MKEMKVEVRIAVIDLTVEKKNSCLMCILLAFEIYSKKSKDTLDPIHIFPL